MQIQRTDVDRLIIRTQAIVLTVSILLLATKWLAFWLTQSISIMTDALESIANVVAGLISLFSLVVSARPRDTNHPYGHGKIELVSASIEGILISIAGVLIIYESINRLINPQELRSLDFGLLLVAGAGLVNYILGFICIRTGQRNHSIALVASGRHLQSDAYSTLGIILGLIILLLSGWGWVDPAVAIIFGAIIIYTGFRILRGTVAGIMDKADYDLLKKVILVLFSHKRENWIDLHNLRIIKFGKILHLDAHLTVPWFLNIKEAQEEIIALENIVQNKFGESIELFVHSDSCEEFSCRICRKPDCKVRQHPFEKELPWDLDNVTLNKKHGQEPNADLPIQGP